MEIGDQPIHYLESIARCDKDVGFAVPGAQLTRQSCSLQRAQRSRANRRHPATALARGRNAGDRVKRNRIQLAVHAVRGDLLHSHRLESTGTDVQRNVGDLHTKRLQPLQHRLIEMQPRCRRRHRTRICGINGLVTTFIKAIRRMLDIRRQWQTSGLLENIEHLGRIEKAQQEHIPGSPGYLRLPAPCQQQPGAGLGRFAGANLRQHLMRAQHPLHQHLDLPATGLGTKHARLDHARIIKYQQIAGRDQLRQIGKHAIAAATGFAVQRQQAARPPLRRRKLSNQLFRQLIIKIV